MIDSRVEQYKKPLDTTNKEQVVECAKSTMLESNQDPLVNDESRANHLVSGPPLAVPLMMVFQRTSGLRR